MPSLQAIKFGGIALGALALVMLGFYGGYRWELPGVQKAQLALAAQVTADSLATAKADQAAAAQLVADTNQNDTVLAAHQGRVSATQAALGAELTQIPAKAAQGGQDGPVAPVLAEALAAIAAQQGAPK
jgi:hypothetical protein